MTYRDRIRREFRMAYPAHRPTLSAWGEAAWTAQDLLHRPGSLLGSARRMSRPFVRRKRLVVQHPATARLLAEKKDSRGRPLLR